MAFFLDLSGQFGYHTVSVQFAFSVNLTKLLPVPLIVPNKCALPKISWAWSVSWVLPRISVAVKLFNALAEISSLLQVTFPV